MSVDVKKLVAMLGALFAVVSVARVSVLFLEALAAVRDERSHDIELLELCAQGSARSSAKMRTACLQAQSDRASPILLKAVLRAVSTAFHDFSESVSSPGKMFVAVLFMLSSVFLPITAWIRALMPSAQQVDGAHHVVVLAHDPATTLGRRQIGFRNGMTEMLNIRSNQKLINFSPGFVEDEEYANGVDHLVDIRSPQHTKWE